MSPGNPQGGWNYLQADSDQPVQVGLQEGRKEISQEDILSISKSTGKINTAIDQAFKDEYFKGGSKINYSGKNIIIRELIEKYIYRKQT